MPAEGSFEANPPFDRGSVERCFRHVVDILASSEAPLSFVVVVPAMDTFDPIDHVEGVARFVRSLNAVSDDEHSFQWGQQHTPRNGNRARGEEWSSTVTTNMYWLQNAAGAERWPTTHAAVACVIKAFKTS